MAWTRKALDLQGPYRWREYPGFSICFLMSRTAVTNPGHHSCGYQPSKQHYHYTYPCMLPSQLKMGRSWHHLQCSCYGYGKLSPWDLILGVEWLSQLGDFKCNYQNNLLQIARKKQEIKVTSDSTLEFVGSCYQLIEVVPQWMRQISESYNGDT